jgi:FkbM family methyltransferase
VTLDTTRPLVTVLMAVHNGEPFVDQAVRSILAQSFEDFEFVIIDDKSTDGTSDRLGTYRDPRIRLIRNEANVGLTTSLNRGLALARGTFVARQDADDISRPTRLAAQVKFLQAHPDVAVLGAQARIIDARGRRVNVAPWPKSTTDLAIRWQLLFDSPFFHACVMFRKAVVWDELGGYDESFTTSQDFELWSRIAARGYAMRNLPTLQVDFRTHQQSASSRYRRESVSKVSAVLHRNLVHRLGPDAVPADWPDSWIRLNNPRLFVQEEDPSPTVVRAILEIHRRFAEREPGSAGDREIRRHVAAMLIRASNAGAERGRLRSWRPFGRAARLEPLMAVSAIPRYAAHLATGRLRRSSGSRAFVELARTIYKSTPVPAVRRVYFDAFCRMVRHRQVRANIHGTTLDLDLGEMIDVAVYLEQYEPDVHAALHRYCKPGMTVLDIGANMGTHTFTMAKLVTPGGAVYAFEPTEFAYTKLVHNLSLNDLPHVRAERIALANCDRERQPIDYRSSWRTGGGRSDSGTGSADFVRLDTWAARRGIPSVDLIKIDIDGNEFDALAGGRAVLERSRPSIVMEAVWPHFADDGRNPFRLLQALGYHFWDAKSGDEYRHITDMARLFPAGDRSMTFSINLIALPAALAASR